VGLSLTRDTDPLSRLRLERADSESESIPPVVQLLTSVSRLYTHSNTPQKV